MELAHPTKAVVHSCEKRALDHKTYILPSVVGLSLVTGQTPLLTRAKRSVASFRLRKQQVLGCKVTVRRAQLARLLRTLVYAVLPQMRELTSLHAEKTQVSFGITSLLNFPHIEEHYELFEHVTGMHLTLEGTAYAALLYSWHGVPVCR